MCLLGSGSRVRILPGALGGLHVSVGPIFTFGSVILVCCGLVPVLCAVGVLVAALCVSGAGAGHAAAVLLCWWRSCSWRAPFWRSAVSGGPGLWRRGEAGQGLAAAF